MDSNNFEWVDFYKEFAEKLLGYIDNRSELINKIKQIYISTGIKMPTLEKDNMLTDIDPFTVFGLFNKKLREENRIKILTEISNLFKVEVPVPKKFDSIPVLNNQNAIFYRFVDDRDPEDIDNLWKLFESALKYSKNPSKENLDTISKYFNLAINIKGNGNSKITMGLYWIAPSTFINLDSRNTWYIYESDKFPNEIVRDLPVIEDKIEAKDYFKILEPVESYLKSSNSELNDFKELSFEAWKYSEQVNIENKQKKLQEESNPVLADDVQTIRYWIYSPGEDSSMWNEFYQKGIMCIAWGELGDLTQFSSKDEMKLALKDSYDSKLSYKNTAHATWQFVNEIKIGDVIFVKKGLHKLLGKGIVTSEYKYDENRSDEYKHIRDVNWTHKGEWDHPEQAATKTLTDITSYTEYVEKLNSIFENELDEYVEEEEKAYPKYSKEDFLSDVYLPEKDYDDLVKVLYKKKNVILQGPPGVGKTYAAKRLAFSLMGEKDVDRVKMVQFHQSYSYEDFIMGFRPTKDGFELKKGAFYNFCKEASIDGENDYFFIIDEINRGNLSKIFGELFMLIEGDKRGVSIQLLYSDEKFSVPKNVYLIGMMNTADRSLAMLDYALRRRFAFFEFKPALLTEGFKEYQTSLNNSTFNDLVYTVNNLNEEISNDESLGEGFCIGHSYFCNLKEENIDNQILSGIIEYELIPLLKEYWFDDPIKVNRWSNALRGLLK